MPNILQAPQHQLTHSPSSLPGGAISTVRQLERALRILRVKDLVERIGLSRATLYVLLSSDPTFPRKIQLTARTVGFYEHEVEAWLASRAQLRVAA